MHLHNLAWPEDKSAYRVTLDTPDDLRLIRALIEDHAAAGLSCGEIIALLDEHPELVALNAHVEQKKLGE
jgi:spore coat polysaccharide biosynthesis protein SpsF